MFKTLIEVWVIGWPIFYVIVRFWFLLANQRWTIGDRNRCAALAAVWPLTAIAVVGFGSQIVCELMVELCNFGKPDKSSRF